MACSFSACKGTGNATGTGALSIVTTIFPEYDWVKNVLGENPGKAELTMLLDNGVDLHSYQPTADDILKISTCDVFVYVGGESDEWVDDALKEAVNKDMTVINLLEVLGDKVKEEEIVEGMEYEHDHDHDEDEDHDEEHEDGDEHAEDHEDEHGDEHDEDHEEGHDHDHEDEEPELDEHVWLSLRNADILVDKIAAVLAEKDSANADTYKKNAADYREKLSALDGKYKEVVSGASVNTLLFGDRFPFRYLVDDYGLSYYAAFVGCSTESKASFETIVFLANKVDELSLRSVMTIEGPDHQIAEAIKDNTASKDQKVLTLDSMQSTTGKDVEAGTTYLSVMEQNLEVLKEALK
ncbi:MAG: zinc ABC transporter substrate-binding protein [Lachnospiraceae bacterium]|nr:zinc ABC transporter substrate-binding protein [Lachnospiraceae bacterium]